MPLQNRVTPGGELIATSARGTLMGNRGILHDDNKEIVRTSRNMMWLICRLEFKGRRRPLMSPRTYTELFFLDEAVALAAGHRPCGECRRSQYRSYMDAVNQGSDEPLDGPKDLDRRLNESRRAPWTMTALATLPDGVFVTLGGYLLGCDLSPELRSHTTRFLRQLNAINPEVRINEPLQIRALPGTTARRRADNRPRR